MSGSERPIDCTTICRPFSALFSPPQKQKKNKIFFKAASEKTKSFMCGYTEWNYEWSKIKIF